MFNLKKKNWTTILLSGVLAVSLTACGGGSKESNASKDNKKESASKNESTSKYPEKPIAVVAPSGAGGGLDTTARSLTKVLAETKLVSQTMNVENKPGGGQSVGLAEFATKDKKDSNRLFLPSTPIIINHLKKDGNSPYSFQDMTPLAQLTKDYEVIAVSPNSKYKDLKSLFEDLKADPKKLTIAGGSSPGSLDHLGIMMPALKAGIDVKQLKYNAYDGGGEAIAALLGNNADVLSTDVSGTMEYLKAGKVRVLAVSSPSRLTGEFKDIPTYKEAGFDTELINWRGVFGAKEMSADAVKYWDEKLKAMTQTEEWKKELQKNGWDDGYKNSADFKKYLEDQEKLIKDVLTSLEMAK
jgi:putative tricarboxylic transport membrane protein